MDVSTLVTSAIRTGVPMLVGFLVSWLTARGFSTTAEQAAGLISFLTALFGWLYYILARVLEMRYPKFGWLLGVPKQVKYNNPK